MWATAVVTEGGSVKSSWSFLFVVNIQAKVTTSGSLSVLFLLTIMRSPDSLELIRPSLYLSPFDLLRHEVLVKTVETVSDFIFWGSKSTADGD